MDILVANVDDYTFDIEILIEDQTGAQILPFPGMDKSTAAVCSYHVRGLCTKGANCPFRHVSGDKTIVCKHWLRGLCKKGDECEFLHEYDMTKMPECYFYTKFNACHNKECPFLHINPDDKKAECPWYDRGFCRHGPKCHNKHVRRVLCTNYFAGFCPEGPECKFRHPRFELPQDNKSGIRKSAIVCHYCGELGHKATSCFKQNPDNEKPYSAGTPGTRTHLRTLTAAHSSPGDYRANRFENVTCFKCGQQGHFANACSKGQFAFLSSNK